MTVLCLELMALQGWMPSRPPSYLVHFVVCMIGWPVNRVSSVNITTLWTRCTDSQGIGADKHRRRVVLYSRHSRHFGSIGLGVYGGYAEVSFGESTGWRNVMEGVKR